MGHPEEARGLLNGHPQSLAHPDSFDDITALAWRDHVKRRVPYHHWKSYRSCLFGLVLLGLTAGILTAFFTSMREEGEKAKLNNSASKSNDPSMSGYGLGDGPGPYWTDGSPVEPQVNCNYDNTVSSSTGFDLAFASGRRFTFFQETTHDLPRPPHSSSVHVSGDVTLRRTNDEHPKPWLAVEIAAENDGLFSAVDVAWKEDNQHLHIRVPSHTPYGGGAGRPPCVNVRVTAWIPPDAEIDGIKGVTSQLDIKLLDDLSLKVLDPNSNAAFNEGSLSLTSVSGSIVSASAGSSARDQRLGDSSPKPPASYRLDSRTISVKTVSGDIHGYLPLYDYLGLESVSGSIAAAVQLKPNADAKKPLPAILHAKSTSGDIELHEPVHEAVDILDSTVEQVLRGQGLVQQADLRAPEYVLPPRDYQVDVQSTSGQIRGNLAFSTLARLHTMSGDVTVNLLPVLNAALASGSSSGAARQSDNKRVVLSTSSISGDTGVTVMDPLWYEVRNGAAAYVVDLAAPADMRARASRQPSSTRPRSDRRQEGPPTLSQQEQQQRPLLILDAQHKTTSAEIKLRYPASWEGDVNMSSLSGDVRADGEGLEIIKSGRGWPIMKKFIEGRKGDGGLASTVQANSLSGDLSFVVG